MSFGIVAFSGFDSDYGFYVRIDHPHLDCYSFYAHLKEQGLAAGTVVQAGDKIGLVGNTGNSTGAHLHFEIRLQNVDGSYKVGTPMPKGRVDGQTWCSLHGLRL
jgi:murein DD-endopeptidase MepM/ murein hydrolase activator NlpD